jgi:hypothetical protein
MALKDWKKITKNKGIYGFVNNWRHVWIDRKTGNYLYLQKIGKNYYIDNSGGGSILAASGHHPQEPIKSLKQALKYAKDYMKKN